MARNEAFSFKRYRELCNRVEELEDENRKLRKAVTNMEIQLRIIRSGAKERNVQRY